jgi:hypothetical protein
MADVSERRERVVIQVEPALRDARRHLGRGARGQALGVAVPAGAAQEEEETALLELGRPADDRVLGNRHAVAPSADEEVGTSNSADNFSFSAASTSSAAATVLFRLMKASGLPSHSGTIVRPPLLIWS